MPAPRGALPELIVVHGISLPPGEFGGPWIDRLFTGNLPRGRASVVSRPSPALRCLGPRADASRRASRAVRAVRPARLARGAVSAWQGRSACNDFSIGIELEGTDDTPYTTRSTSSCGADRRVARRLSVAVGASTSSATATSRPGRKTDPGARFDWARCSDAARWRAASARVALLRCGRAARALRCRARAAPARAPARTAGPTGGSGTAAPPG